MATINFRGVKIEASATPDPRIETVKKITEALGISLDSLIK